MARKSHKNKIPFKQNISEIEKYFLEIPTFIIKITGGDFTPTDCNNIFNKQLKWSYLIYSTPDNLMNGKYKYYLIIYLKALPKTQYEYDFLYNYIIQILKNNHCYTTTDNNEKIKIKTEYPQAKFVELEGPSTNNEVTIYQPSLAIIGNNKNIFFYSFNISESKFNPINISKLCCIYN